MFSYLSQVEGDKLNFPIPLFFAQQNTMQLNSKTTKAKGLLRKTTFQICINLVICDTSYKTYKDMLRSVQTFHKG